MNFQNNVFNRLSTEMEYISGMLPLKLESAWIELQLVWIDIKLAWRTR